MAEPFEHFIRLARRGRFPAASGGERRAYAIALALLENSPGLDETAQEGAVDFMHLAAADYFAAKDLLDADQ